MGYTQFDISCYLDYRFISPHNQKIKVPRSWKGLSLEGVNLRTKEEIEKIVKSYIESVEKLSDQTGGSGHMGYVGYELVKFNSEYLQNKLQKITFTYKIFVETEFTYYPDNPPHETEYEKEIVIDDKSNIISEKTISAKTAQIDDSAVQIDWTAEQNKILFFIEELLARIEWQYGENRAPIKYPPEFFEEPGKFKCIVKLEENAGVLIFESDNPENLTAKVIEALKTKFYPR